MLVWTPTPIFGCYLAPLDVVIGDIESLLHLAVKVTYCYITLISFAEKSDAYAVCKINIEVFIDIQLAMVIHIFMAHLQFVRSY